MKTLRLIFLALTVAALNISWTTGINPIQNQQDTKKQVAKRVSQEEFKTKLKSLKNVQLIDVRTPGEFKKGNIEGAVNIDFNSPDFKSKIAQLTKDKPTLIYCHSGGRSARALQQFKSLGFEYVLELENGYSQWVK